MFGEFLVNAQGEDVVAGIRTPRPLQELEAVLPGAYGELISTMGLLEAHYRDMQDIEFTIERGTLYLLQTRTASAPRGGPAHGARPGGGGRDRARGGGRADRPARLDQLLHPTIDPERRPSRSCAA